MAKLKSKYADEHQAELYKKFPADSFLANPSNLDHLFLWVTFWRRNLHRFVMDYLKIKLYPYQAMALYELGVSKFNVIIACRAAAKSFLIAIYACCMCILYPYTKVVIVASTKMQAKLIVSEKIRNELMNMSPMLRNEIERIKDNQNEVIVYFRNHSTITVVPASENARGYRSTIAIREEFRQIKKEVDDSIISPFQIIRNAPYMVIPHYSGMDELKEEAVDVYISSSWYDSGGSSAHWLWGIVDQAYSDMVKGKSSVLLAFDESITLKHNIKSKTQLIRERKKQDPITWKLEFLNCRLKENQSAFFGHSLFEDCQNLKQPWYPRTDLDVRSNRKNPYDIPRQRGEIRVIACDMAFVASANNDNSAFTLARLLPETSSSGVTRYRIIICYIEAFPGGEVQNQAIRIRQLKEDFGADYVVIDGRNSGIAVVDLLARVLYDDKRGKEYSPISCMNIDSIAARNKRDDTDACVYVINANQKLNSDIAINFRRMLAEKQIELLVPFQEAEVSILNNYKEYLSAPDADTQFFYERPFLETQALIAECCALVYEKKEQTGAIVVHEQGKNRKDRYSSASYLAYFVSQLQLDLTNQYELYEYGVYIN